MPKIKVMGYRLWVVQIVQVVEIVKIVEIVKMVNSAQKLGSQLTRTKLPLNE